MSSDQTESLFALANGHIGLRGNLDEGEPHGIPGTYLNGLYASRPLPYAEIAYGYPEAGQSIVERDKRQAGPAAGRGRAPRPPLRRSARARAGARLPRRRPAPHACVWRSPAGRVVRVKSTRLVSLVQRAVAGDPLRGRGCRRWRPAPRRRPVRARRQRGDAGARRVGSARRRRDPRAADRRSHRAARARTPPSSTGPRAPICCSPRRWITSVSGVDEQRREELLRGRPRAPDGDRRPRARRAARDRQAARLRLLVGALGAGDARPGRGRAGRGPPRRLRRSGCAHNAMPSTTSGPAPTSRSTATPSSSRRSASPSSTCCSPRRAATATRSPPRA